MLRLYETHMHTPLCKHAEGEPGDYAEVAEARGLNGIIVTCHNPMPGDMSPGERMLEAEFERYLEMVEAARRAWAGRVDVRLGLECDYMPGFEPWLEKQIASARFDYILASVHPHIAYYREQHWQGDAFAYQQTYFEHLARAAETGLFDSLAHPTLVRHVTAADWDFERLRPCIEASLDRIAATGVAMELNTSPKEGGTMPDAAVLGLIAERQIPMTLGSDAHQPGQVTREWDYALTMLEEAGVVTLNVFLEREAHPQAVAEIRDALVTAI